MIVERAAVHGRTSFEKQTDKFGILSFDGHVQTAQAVLVGSVNAAALLYEHLGDLVVAFGDAQHNGRYLVHGHAKVDVWIDFVGGKEISNRLHVVRRYGEHEMHVRPTVRQRI